MNDSEFDPEYEDEDETGSDSEFSLNEMAWELVSQILTKTDELRVAPVEVEGGGCVIDFGVEAPGCLSAGLALAEVCTAGLAEIHIHPGEIGGLSWPQIFVSTDSPVEACLLSQYAGWRISVGKYFAMGSGPMRIAAGSEQLFQELDMREEGVGAVGILETNKLPTPEVLRKIAKDCGCEQEQLALLVAPTASPAGSLQVVARSVETALHKLHELGYPLGQIESACGWAPLAPVGKDDMQGIGRTNDAILYGGRVHLYVTGSDEDILRIGAQVPASASAMYGRPFLEIFEAAGRDFYKIDPLLFSPGEIVFQNIDTGRVHHFGKLNPEVLRASFGL